MELKFHTPSYEELALKQPEPEESLEELLLRHKMACDDYHQFVAAKEKAEALWRRTRIDAQGNEVTYIDYDAWDEADSKSYWKFAMADFNGNNGIDTLECMIDIKISHMNQRERER